MRAWRALIVGAIIIGFLIISFNSSAQETYSENSWALGLVIPEGADLQGGNSLNWASVKNVTAVMVLPNVSLPDNIVYGVLSIMTTDGYVLQVAAGVFPHASNWLVYSWLFTDLASTPVKYQWVLNESEPSMSPGAAISISVFKSSPDSWSLNVTDLNTGSSIDRLFPLGIAPDLKSGDQEVIAFESYSTNPETFEDMGNFTLKALLFDGKDLSSGFYTYDSSWNPAHNPMFIIGTEGMVPPTFIELSNSMTSVAVWSYAGDWASNAYFYPNWSEIISIAGLLVGAIAVVSFTFVKINKPKLN